MTYARLVPLTRGLFALVDDLAFARVAAAKWSAVPTSCLRRNHYAVARIDGKVVKMHRFLTDAAPGEEVDHGDGDGLNNTGQNLKNCSRQENAQNSGRGGAAALSVGLLPPSVRGYTYTRGLERPFPAGSLVPVQPGLRYVLAPPPAAPLVWTADRYGHPIIAELEAALELEDWREERVLIASGLCDRIAA